MKRNTFRAKCLLTLLACALLLPAGALGQGLRAEVSVAFALGERERVTVWASSAAGQVGIRAPGVDYRGRLQRVAAVASHPGLFVVTSAGILAVQTPHGEVWSRASAMVYVMPGKSAVGYVVMPTSPLTSPLTLSWRVQTITTGGIAIY